MASSSWSHAFLTEKNFWAYPDLEADRTLLSYLKTWAYHKWKDVTLDDVEQAGQQEVLNWFCLIGTIAELRPVSESGGGGNRTRVRASYRSDTSAAEPQQIGAIFKHFNALPDPITSGPEQKLTLSEHRHNTSLHRKCATCVPHHFPDDLRQLMDVWYSLPEVVKAGILAMIKAVR